MAFLEVFGDFCLEALCLSLAGCCAGMFDDVNMASRNFDTCWPDGLRSLTLEFRPDREIGGDSGEFDHLKLSAKIDWCVGGQALQLGGSMQFPRPEAPPATLEVEDVFLDGDVKTQRRQPLFPQDAESEPAGLGPVLPRPPGTRLNVFGGRIPNSRDIDLSVCRKVG